ncbi:hypothetical protein ACFU99_02650 [Streptomyces sp. NPDC057654]|uniref:hypothetical protein n=1 Tax=Streptomyces sp. NPDC057654 TaxID=3346196 RepID=UPI0036B14BD3
MTPSVVDEEGFDTCLTTARNAHEILRVRYRRTATSSSNDRLLALRARTIT